ncbi:damage-inducible protein DinB [Pusillimonas caeni]|uniref:DinB family protein n=1 Tax=Pusillimonas caeni TaxID=1348472 RepID=UPI000E59ACE5|nr:DinB family protein [Pusillimonas caeni]TFL13603.1 damage-inducible protein DinB [Pusillimonas caeni]
MTDPDMLQVMAGYNRWMNERLYDVCAGMSDEERKRDMKAFFGSIHKTFNHILLADRVWLGRLAAQPFEVHSLDQELYADFQALARERAMTDSEIEDTVSNLSPERLKESITYRSISRRQEATLPCGLILLHMFNHQTHHRGQVTAIMSQLGRDFGVTDLIAFPGANHMLHSGGPRHER